MKKTIILLCILVLTGCASFSSNKKVSLPEKLSDKGLLIAEIHFGDLLMFGKINIVINGSYRGTLQEGYVTIPLLPGSYTFDRLEHKSKGFSSYYGDVKVTRINIRRKFINRKFDIKPGKVTNLGVTVFSPDSEKNYFVFDNTKEIKAYLKHHYPELYENLGNDDFLMAEGRYAPRSIINSLRKRIANKSLIYFRTSKTGILGEKYITGPLGTLAKLNSNNGTIIDATPLPIDTLAPVVSGSSFEKKVAVLTGDDRIYVVEKGILNRLSYPVEMLPSAVHLFGPQGIALVDGRGKIITSQDDGKTWKFHSAHMRKVEKNIKDTHFDGQNGENGFYLHSKNEKGTRPMIVYSPYDHIHFTPIALPKSLKEIHGFWAKDSGLFIDLGPNVFSNAKFYYQAPGEKKWVQRSMPDTSCHLGFEDEAGKTLIANCYQRYNSIDMGLTWKAIPNPR